MFDSSAGINHFGTTGIWETAGQSFLFQTKAVLVNLRTNRKHNTATVGPLAFT